MTAMQGSVRAAPWARAQTCISRFSRNSTQYSTGQNGPYKVFTRWDGGALMQSWALGREISSARPYLLLIIVMIQLSRLDWTAGLYHAGRDQRASFA